MSTILKNLEEQFLAGPQSLYELDVLNGTGLTITSAEYQQFCQEVNDGPFTDDEKDALINGAYKGRKILIEG